MDLKLADTVAFVSGSSRGIGRAIAAGFLAEGARVTITGRNRDSLETTRNALAEAHGSARVFATVGDLTAPDGIAAVLSEADAHWGRLDHVVANLGDGRSIAGWNVGDAEWERVLEVNFRGAVRLVEAAMPRLARQKSASITLIGSIAGLEALSAPIAYSTAKAALAAYTTALARQVASSGIRVNCVAPGNILAPGGSWERRISEDRTAVENYISREVPLSRFGSPEEIADLVVFLSSTRSSFTTGSCFVADGGQTRRLA